MRKFAYAVALTAAISAGAYYYAHFKHMRPAAEPPLLLKKGNIVAHRQIVTEVEQQLKNAVEQLKNANNNNNTEAKNASQSIISLVKQNPSLLEKAFDELTPLFAFPYLDIKNNIQQPVSKAALEILKSFPKKSIELALSRSNEYFSNGPDSHYYAMGYIVSAIVAEVPSVRECANTHFKEVLYLENNWGAKIVIGICAVKNEMVDLNVALSTAASNSTSLENMFLPDQIKDTLIDLAKKLNKINKAQMMKQTPKIR